MLSYLRLRQLSPAAHGPGGAPPRRPQAPAHGNLAPLGTSMPGSTF